MKNCIAILLLSGFTQAAVLSNVVDATEEATEDLSIKMPEVVAQQTANTKPQASLSLVQSETNTQLGMFESGVLHGSLKPIVKAKVKKTMNFVRSTKDQYEHGTTEEKKAIQAKAESLIMTSTGTREYNEELCMALWSEYSEIAGILSFAFCPSLIFPATNLAGAPPLASVQGSAPTRLRSAFLTQYFWNAELSKDVSSVQSMLSPGVCYYWGQTDGICGVDKVSKTLPYIGFPADSKLSDPVQWHCDTTSCIAPVKAWAEHSNFCLLTFDSTGKVTEAIVPLDLWR